MHRYEGTCVVETYSVEIECLELEAKWNMVVSLERKHIKSKGKYLLMSCGRVYICEPM